MYSRKNRGPRTEPSGTLTLTGYSCEDFASRSTQRKCKKKQNRKNIKQEQSAFSVAYLSDYINCCIELPKCHNLGITTLRHAIVRQMSF